MQISLQQIKIDGGTQSRVALNQETIAEYADAYIALEKMPELTVFFDGAIYWLADGFHRFFAARKAELPDVECDIRQGTQRDAILYSVSANHEHGLRRSNADKRNAILTLLRDKEWGNWSDREIAKRAKVGHPLVSEMRRDLRIERAEISARIDKYRGVTHEAGRI